MKNTKVIALLLASLLVLTIVGCGNNGDGDSDGSGGGDGGDTTVPGEYVWTSMIEPGPLDYDVSKSKRYNVCGTDEVVYTCADEMIIFFDKASGLSMPLCGKPECSHDDATCNAYAGRKCNALSVYDGKLYWVDDYYDTMTVRRCGPDGTNRETVVEANMDHSLSSLVMNDRRMFFHRGYLYVYGSGLVNGKSLSTVLSVSLTDGAVTKVFSKDIGGRFEVVPVGDEIYMMISNASGRDLANFVWGTEHLEAHKLDLTTGVLEQIFSFDSDVENISYECWGFLPVPGDGIYFERTYEYEKTEGKGDYTSLASILKYSFITGEIEEVTPKLDADGQDEFFSLTFMRDCILGRLRGAAHLFDYGGNYLGSAKCNAMTSFEVYKDEKYVYYCEMIMEGMSSTGEFRFIAAPIGGGESIIFE